MSDISFTFCSCYAIIVLERNSRKGDIMITKKIIKLMKKEMNDLSYGSYAIAADFTRGTYVLADADCDYVTFPESKSDLFFVGIVKRRTSIQRLFDICEDAYYRWLDQEELFTSHFDPAFEDYSDEVAFNTSLWFSDPYEGGF